MFKTCRWILPLIFIALASCKTEVSDLVNLIPSNTQQVLVINCNSIQDELKKSPKAARLAAHFLKENGALNLQAINNLGIDLSKNIYGFMQPNSDYETFVFLGALKNVAQFNATVQQLTSNNSPWEHFEVNHIPGEYLMTAQGLWATFNKKGFFIGSKKTSSLAILKEELIDVCTNKTSLIESNHSFKAFEPQVDCAGVWSDMSGVNFSSLTNIPYLSMLKTSLNFKGSYSWIFAHLDQDVIHANMQYDYAPIAQKWITDNSCLTKQFKMNGASFVSSESLAVASVSFNPQKVFDLLLNSIAGPGEDKKNMEAAIDASLYFCGINRAQLLASLDGNALYVKKNMDEMVLMIGLQPNSKIPDISAILSGLFKQGISSGQIQMWEQDQVEYICSGKDFANELKAKTPPSSSLSSSDLYTKMKNNSALIFFNVTPELLEQLPSQRRFVDFANAIKTIEWINVDSNNMQCTIELR